MADFVMKSAIYFLRLFKYNFLIQIIISNIITLRVLLV
jgi:hypothetical protein